MKDDASMTAKKRPSRSRHFLRTENPGDVALDDSESPEVLARFAEKIQSLRADVLCGGDFYDANVLSTQHYLLALEALGTAERFMRLALYHRRRGD